MAQIEFFVRQKYRVQSGLQELEAASESVLLAEVRSYLAKLTRSVQLGPVRLFTANLKAVLKALVGQALWMIAKMHRFEGKWGHPTRLILTFWDEAQLKSPAVLAMTVE